jgi:hypothetical protein
MSPEAITIIALLAVLLGVALVGVVQLAVIISQLADLKAYTMTQTSLLQRLPENPPIQWISDAP